ncbi:hypothetical protein GCM10009107_53130 [Ideonella azotifigens]|uniref:Core-binding (CB) domain-containing protein n=1 Tax=Ideonella azotifigens TaxID=513160 RepID=A0ABN1KGK8_9BURK
MTELAQELRRYDHMELVRGLAPKTREGALRLVEALLRKHFGDDTIQFDVITPERVRRFFAAQAKNYKAPTSLGAVVSALRGYFRWRATLGDRIHALVGALAYPANWQLAAGIVAPSRRNWQRSNNSRPPSARAARRCCVLTPWCAACSIWACAAARSHAWVWTISTGKPARSPCAGPRAGVKT